MFYNRVVVTPGLGKVPQVRALLTERVKASQSRVRSLLTERVFGDGISFVVGTWHENLAALEKENQFNRTDAATQEFLGKIGQLTGKLRDSQLYRVVGEGISSDKKTTYTHLVRFRTYQGGDAALGEALQKLATGIGNDIGVPMTVLRQSFSVHGPTYVAVSRYENLTEYENIITEYPPSIKQVTEDTKDLLTEAAAHALFQMVVPAAGPVS